MGNLTHACMFSARLLTVQSVTCARILQLTRFNKKVFIFFYFLSKKKFAWLCVQKTCE